MEEKLSESEKKLLKHWITIHENELNNQSNSLMDIYNDYGCPNNKFPWMFLFSFAYDISEKSQPLSFEEATVKEDLAQFDVETDMPLAMYYLESMDSVNFNNSELYNRFSEADNVLALLDEMFGEEKVDNSDDYDDLPF